MQWREFIFSTHQQHRVSRHLAFWLLWWVYFWISTYVLYPATIGTTTNAFAFWHWNLNDLLRSLFMVGIHIGGCYLLLCVLSPLYLFNKKYLSFTMGVLLLAGFILGISLLATRFIFPFIDTLFEPYTGRLRKKIIWVGLDGGLLSSLKIIALAAGVKLVKFWWQKQEEKEKLEREKINAELKLLKAQIHPAFLFQTLNNIYADSVTGSPRASEMLLKLSDFLSYMLYECDMPWVPLEKEIETMKEYMILEKIRYGDNIEITLDIKGDMANKKIAPFLLLPFIENSLKLCNNVTEQSWMTMELKTEREIFSMKLLNGSTPGTIAAIDGLADVQKRLTLLYPGAHELKIIADGEMFLVLLDIQLNGANAEVSEKENNSEVIDKRTSLIQADRSYATN